MTDHYAVVNPEELRPVETPQGPFTCDVCGLEFKNQGGLSVHRRSHEPKQSCPECGEMFQPGPGMSRHRQANHGLAKIERKVDRKVCPECGKAIIAKDLLRHRRDVHHVDIPKGPQGRSKEPALTVDDLFTAAVGMLFPKGVIPVSKLEPLFRWREDTQRMLDEVSGG